MCRDAPPVIAADTNGCYPQLLCERIVAGRGDEREGTHTRERDRLPSPGIRRAGWWGLLLDRLQVVHDLGALLCVGATGKRHRVSGDRLLRVGEEGVERFVVPGDFGVFHRPAVGESGLRASLVPEH